jgi:hypothetical protein
METPGDDRIHLEHVRRDGVEVRDRAGGGDTHYNVL